MARKKTTRKSVPLGKLKAYSKQDEPVTMFTSDKDALLRKNRLKSWVTFYRKNPSFFVEHYFGIILFPYQRFWINLMSRCTEFVGIASRASAKSWLIAVYAMARCVLYPGTTVALASSTKAQAGLIISEKAVGLIKEYPNLQREILTYTTNQNKWEVVFKNGSKINVVVSGEGGRGHRSNITVLEERRLIPNETIDSIIRPFLVARQPAYMKNPKYSQVEELKEEPIEVIISSAYYKSYEWYPEIKKFIKQVAAGEDDTKIFFLDYPISLYHGIKTKKQMKREKENLDPISFIQEYGNIPYGSSLNSFYKLGLFRRNIKRSWRPITDELHASGKGNPYDIPKQADEIRIVSVDIAMRAGSTNDNTVIACARLFPGRKGYNTEICYMESHNGKNTNLQALRIKQIYEEFEGDTLVLDIANAGISVFDALTSVTKDEVRGLEYPAYSVSLSSAIDNKVYDELLSRTLAQTAVQCIFPISATSSLNSLIAVRFRERLKKRLVNFLIDDNAEEEFLIKSGNKDILDPDDMTIRARLLQAHLQTTLAINEAIALEMSIVSGNIKLEEPEGCRKDRYTAIAYLNYYVSLLDGELLKEEDGTSDLEAFLSVARVF